MDCQARSQKRKRKFTLNFSELLGNIPPFRDISFSLKHLEEESKF